MMGLPKTADGGGQMAEELSVRWYRPTWASGTCVIHIDRSHISIKLHAPTAHRPLFPITIGHVTNLRMFRLSDDPEFLESPII